MKNTLAGGLYALVTLFAGHAYSGEYPYLPVSDPANVGAVITNAHDALVLGFVAPSFMKVQGTGGVSASVLDMNEPLISSAFIVDSEGMALGRVPFEEKNYRLSAAVTGLSVEASGSSWPVGAPTIQVAGGVRIEMPVGDLPYVSLHGQTPQGMLAAKGGFIEITNIELSAGSVFGTVSGANGLVTQDHVLLLEGRCLNPSALGCYPSSIDLSQGRQQDLLSWVANVQGSRREETPAMALFRQGLGLLSTDLSELPLEPAQSLGLMLQTSGMPIISSMEARVQFQSPFGYLPVPEPGSMLLMSLGLLGVVAGVRRQSRLAGG